MPSRAAGAAEGGVPADVALPDVRRGAARVLGRRRGAFLGGGEVRADVEDLFLRPSFRHEDQRAKPSSFGACAASSAAAFVPKKCSSPKYRARGFSLFRDIIAESIRRRSQAQEMSMQLLNIV